MLNIIRLYDDSRAVEKLQRALMCTMYGAQLRDDGVFGPKTEEAVKGYQKARGLAVDGIVGPATIASLRLDMRPDEAGEADFVRAAQRLGVTVAHVKTVADVETAREAFMSDGRTPILFERHVFWKQCIIPRRPGDTQASLKRQRDTVWAKTHSDICNPKAGGYGRSSAQYDRLARAQSISDTAALESASWGSFQIMGYHGVNIGWHSVQAFVRAMQASQADHLRAFVGWIIAHPAAHRALQASDWHGFARVYNGPAYAKGPRNYAVEMQKAFTSYTA